MNESWRIMTRSKYQQMVRHDYAGPKSSLLPEGQRDWNAPYWSLQFIDGMGTCLVPTVVYDDNHVSYFGEWIDNQGLSTRCEPTTFEAAQAWLVEEVARNLRAWQRAVGQAHGYRYRDALTRIETVTEPTQIKVNWHTLQIVPFAAMAAQAPTGKEPPL